MSSRFQYERLAATVLAAPFLAASAGATQLGAKPILLGDLRPGPIGSSPLALLDVQGKLYFTADDGTHGRELWVSDGTLAGTKMVVDLVAGPGSGLPGITGGMGQLAGEVYFPANGNQLWKSDGTAGGTVLVRDFAAPAAPPRVWTELNGELFFEADDGISGREAWKTDGTVLGTTLTKDIRIGTQGSIVSTVGSNHAELWGRLCFVADDGVSGPEVWWSDGTTGGTSMLLELNQNGGSFPDWLVNDGQTFWWVMTDPNFGRELVRIEVPSGLGPWVSDINPGAAGSSPMNLAPWKGGLYFAAELGIGFGHEPWVFSPGAGLPQQLADIAPGLGGSISPNAIDPFVPSGGEVFFRADDGSSGSELWKTDGTPGGTMLVKDLLTGPAGSKPQYMVDASGELLFAAQASGGGELWRSDGRAQGTHPFFEIHPTGSAAPDQLTRSGSTLFLVANDGLAGRELWALDASFSGTSYCTSGTSATGCTATISAAGVASASEATGFVVTVSRMSPGQDGIVFLGTNGRQANPWGNGTSFQCVIPPVKRSPILTSTGTSGCSGRFQFDLNAWFALLPHKAPNVGSLAQVQGWYRDPLNTSNQTTSLSNALEFTYCP